MKETAAIDCWVDARTGHHYVLGKDTSRKLPNRHAYGVLLKTSTVVRFTTSYIPKKHK